MQIIHDSGHPPGTIILAAAMHPRYYEFTTSMDRLEVPAGSKYLIERSCDITQNFNQGLKKMSGEWVWFMGDDHAFPPETLMRLLAHNKDVVVPLTPCKVAAWPPCIIHGPKEGEKIWDERMNLYRWDELSDPGIFKLPMGDFIGQAGMLVRKRVIDAIGYPWFKCGQFDPGRLQEDMYFCRELQQKGFDVWVDRDIVMEHYFTIGIGVRKHEGKYAPALQSGGTTVVLPDAVDLPRRMPDIGEPQRPPVWRHYTQVEQPHEPAPVHE